MSKLFAELKRRKIFKVAAVYAVVSWLLIQVATAITPALLLPTWTPSLVVVLLLLGFIPTLIAAWAYEMTPEGLRPDSASLSAAQIPTTQHQTLIYVMLVLLLIAVGLQIADRFLAGSSSSNQSLNAGATRANQPLPETRLEIVTPATDRPQEFALSPDGRQIVFVASDDSGTSQLWLRSLASTTADPLTGTEGATRPFWSPDGRSIGFNSASGLKRLDIGGGAPQTLSSLIGNDGSSWGADDTLLVAQGLGANPLMRQSVTGGAATAFTTLEPGQTNHRYPYFLPDGRWFLFTVQGTPETAGIYLGHLDGTAPVRLTADNSSGGVFHPDGWLLWSREGTLTAQRLDLAQAVLTGNPIALADGVEGRPSVTPTGLIAYRTGSAADRQLTWIDRTGTELGTLGEPDSSIRNPRLAPDGRRVAVGRGAQGNQDIWLLDGARSSRFTFDPAFDGFHLWSPDGSRMVFRSGRTAGLPGDLYLKSSSGAVEETLWVSSDQSKTPNSWSADSRFLMYTTITTDNARDLWAVPMTGNPMPFLVLQTPFNELAGAFSPDGRWIAYESDESGRYEVYIRAFVAPDTGAAPAVVGQWQISTAGGRDPLWSPDGQELYYLDPAGNMVAAPIMVTGDRVEVGAPAVLFPTRIVGGGRPEFSLGRQYDVAPDGRFLINTEVGEGADAPITLILNWSPEAVQ